MLPAAPCKIPIASWAAGSSLWLKIAIAFPMSCAEAPILFALAPIF